MKCTLKLPTKEEFKKEIDEFNSSATDLYHRYASFDICYSYFRSNQERLTIDLEKSCCILWSYLGSWGMLRGSSFLLQDKNPAFLIDLIKYIQNDCQDIFDIDVDKYMQNNIKYNEKTNIQRLCDVYDEIYKLLGGSKTTPSSTLITKIMLGVFGCIPAFDQFFCETLGNLTPRSGIKSNIVSEKSLKAIYEFYYKYGLRGIINSYANRCSVANIFGSGTSIYKYSKAKIIDMYGFNVGFMKAEAKKVETRAKAEVEIIKN